MLDCVLIIDDDRVSNIVTEKVMRSMEFASMINTVNDGQAGLEYIKYQCSIQDGDNNFACPDLIVLDMSMRLIDGVEFVRRYRKLNLNIDAVIVVLSSLPLRPKEKEELAALGVNDFFVKPLNAEKMLSIMDEYFYQSF